jgi:hypothetical protein
MLFGPLDFLLALKPKHQRRAMVCVGLCLSAIGAGRLFFEHDSTRRVVESLAVMVLGAAIAGWFWLDIRDEKRRETDGTAANDSAAED